MSTGPIKFIRYHPVGFTMSALAGMIAGPWALSILKRTTGISLGVPSFSANYSVSSDGEDV